MLTAKDFLRLLQAGVLSYGRSLDHPNAAYVVRGAPSDIELRPAFFPVPLKSPRSLEGWGDMRDRRVAQALEDAAKAGRLNGHTMLWLHARLAELTDPATPRSA